MTTQLLLHNDVTQLTETQTITTDLFTKFIAYVDASPATVKAYTRSIRQFASWLHFKGIDRPTREDILTFREELKEDHKPTTVQAYITAVRLFFQFTELEGYYPNIANHVKGAKLDRNHKKDYLSSRQVKKVLDQARNASIEGLRNYAILSIMFTGGLRTIEVVRANIGDLRTVGEDVRLYVQGKGHEEKTDYIKLIPQVEDAVRAYLKARNTADSTAPLFTSESNNSRGARLTTRSVSRIVKQAFIEAGYNSDKLTAHSTRHTAVTLALANGMKLEEVQQFARHSNIATTQIYAHNLEREANKCEQTIGRAIFG